MSEPPDPALVDRCAGLARAHAADLRVRARRLGATAEASAWAGPAARAFRDGTQGLVDRLVSAAGHLDDAADLLTRHAAALRAGAPR